MGLQGDRTPPPSPSWLPTSLPLAHYAMHNGLLHVSLTHYVSFHFGVFALAVLSLLARKKHLPRKLSCILPALSQISSHWVLLWLSHLFLGFCFIFVLMIGLMISCLPGKCLSRWAKSPALLSHLKWLPVLTLYSFQFLFPWYLPWLDSIAHLTFYCTL